jgi:hypothetical protein
VVAAAQTVPDLMLGCWKRAWIEFADGTPDDTTTVVWLQTESLMADVRIAADRGDLQDRAGFAQCSDDELRAIGAADASSGYTECDSAEQGADGVPRATATWHTRGHGVNFQPVSAFPEPGLMSWNDDGTVMMEHAPSGAYVEEWRLVPGSRDHLSVTEVDDEIIYRAGPVAVLVRDRRVAIPRPARLLDLLDDCNGDRPAMEALLDCEFSIAELDGTVWTITASTLPWREGEVLDVDG